MTQQQDASDQEAQNEDLFKWPKGLSQDEKLEFFARQKPINAVPLNMDLLNTFLSLKAIAICTTSTFETMENLLELADYSSAYITAEDGAQLKGQYCQTNHAGPLNEEAYEKFAQMVNKAVDGGFIEQGCIAPPSSLRLLNHMETNEERYILFFFPLSRFTIEQLKSEANYLFIND